jgi:O-antigen/teichoic acid export membrane protein
MAAASGQGPGPGEAGSLRRSVAWGALWMGGALWTTRGLGLLSTTILARLLLPRDFGLVAMATVVTGLLGVLFTFGIDTALIQKAEATRADWDTAWTLGLLQGLLLAGLVIVLAPLVARFYEEPRVMPIMLVLAGGICVGSLENIGVVAFRKELQFRRNFNYVVIKKLFQVVVTVSLAFALRSYWALLGGTVATQAFAAAFSYVAHPFRPRWSMERAGELLGFTTRLALINLARYFTFDGERLIIGALTGARLTGLYALSAEFAQMPTAELSGAFVQAIFPGLVKLKHDRDRVRAGYLSAFGIMALYALPAGIGIAIVAPDLVPVLLGAKWIDAIPIFQVIAVAGALRAVYGPAYNLLIVFGRLDNVQLVSWLQAGLQAVLLIPVIGWFGLVGAAALNTVLAAITLGFCIVQVARCAGISLRDHVAVLWRPILSTAVMVPVCTMVSSLIATPVPALAGTVLAGVASYVLATLALWLLSGRPRGPEWHLLEIVGARLGIAP